MTQAIPGAPIGPDIEPSRSQRVYDHVPRLRELLPNGGWPGVVYAQVCVHNLKAAADRTDRPANLRPIRGATYYSIQGPKGETAMALVGCGQPIPGAAPEAGERLFFTDGEVEEQTGLKIGAQIWFTAASSHTQPLPAPDVAVPPPFDEPPRQKRKYVRKAPYKSKPGSVRTRNVHGRYKNVTQEAPAPEASDGTQELA